MADPTTPAAPAQTPALPSTANSSPYIPVSWMAVAAMATSTLFLLILLVGGLDAIMDRRPLLIPEVLALPAIAVVLSFAARRIIRNAEGTRTGELFGIDLPNAAWWIAIVAGLGYGAYWLAIGFAIRRDAQAEVQRWIETLQKVEVDPAIIQEDQNLSRAFYRTRDPKEREGIPPTDAQQLQGRWGNEFVAFRQSDLVRLLVRNPGRTEVAIGGLRDWTHKPGGIDCVYNLTIRCPEGVFPVQVPLKGVEMGAGSGGTGGRQWQVILGASGFLNRDSIRLTPYGWLVLQLEVQGAAEGRRFIDSCGQRLERPFAYVRFAAADEPELRNLTGIGQFGRVASAGVPTGFNSIAIPAALTWTPTTQDFARTASRLFTQLGGTKPNDNQMKTFQEAWNTVGFAPAGSRLQGNPDIHNVVVFTDSSIQVRVPIEIPLSATTGAISAARGRIVLECTTPGIFEEAGRLRGAANPDQATSVMPEDIRQRTLTWKLLRVESDLRPVQVEREPGPGEPGGAGPAP